MSSFILGFLQDSRSWILFPERVNFYSSNDNKEFTLIDGVDNQNQPTREAVLLLKFSIQKFKEAEFLTNCHSRFECICFFANIIEKWF